MTPTQIAAIKGMLAYFDSGNNIPVDKAVIKANCAEVAALRAALAETEPRNHVGDSQFESWFSEYNPSGKGDKQRARDAYAAGMGDPVYVTAQVQEPQPVESAVKGAIMGAAYDFRDAHISGSTNLKRSAHAALEAAVDAALKPAPEQEIIGGLDDATRIGWAFWRIKDLEQLLASRPSYTAPQPAPPADVPMIEQKAVEPVGFVNRAAVNSAIIDRARGVGDTHTWSEKKTSFHSVPFYTSPQPAPHADVPMLTDEELREAFAQNLSDTYVCSRVWIAWSYGTMSEDDFSPASECDELLDSLVQAVRQKAGLK